MAVPDHQRRLIAAAMLSMPLLVAARRRGATRRSIVEDGAVADGRTVNTVAIQRGIDRLAGEGGGTLVVPRGTFVSGALFLKPGVDLHLDRGAVLRCTTDMTHFPPRRTRIEGHFEPAFTPALINADGCDGLRITGEGTLNGAGRPIWDRFWAMRAAAPDPASFPNLGLPRARLALIERSRDVLIEGVTFEDSQFWNLHLYRCQGVTVRSARFVVPDDYKQAPSTDGIDVDSCQDVTVDGCYFSITDDCVALKGSKGLRALEDRSSPPVERVRVRNCHFRRGHHALACGSEATIVRGVTVEDCTVTGDMILVRLKLRPDTPQRYEDIAIRRIRLDSEGGAILGVQPWTQYTDLRGQTPPASSVQRLTLSGISGRFGAFGTLCPDPRQTTIRDVTLRDIDVRLAKPALAMCGVVGLTRRDVMVNGRPVGGGA